MDKKWYVLKVRSRYEKAVAEEMAKQYEIFLPLIKKRRKWSDRIKIIDAPLFPGYLFVFTDIKQKFYILEIKGVSGFIRFGEKEASIHEKELKALEIMLKEPQSLEVQDTHHFNEGENVKVINGVFAGLTGKVRSLKNKCRLYILIEQLGKLVSVEIDSNAIEKA